jgi:hypothetical protein
MFPLKPVISGEKVLVLLYPVATKESIQFYGAIIPP